MNKPAAETPAPKPRGRRWLLYVGLIALLLVGGGWGFSIWEKMAGRIGTDDAYVTADVSSITPQVQALVTGVYVQDNQVVKAGDLLVTLDDSTFRTAVSQAQANLAAAVAQAQGAGVTVDLTAETGNAQILQARGGVEQAQSTIAGYRADLGRTAAGIDQASATAKAAQSAVTTAQAGVAVAQANQDRAKAGVDTARAQVDAAQAAVRAARSAVTAAQASQAKAERDAQRYATLAAQGAVSEQMGQDAQTALDLAKAQVENAQQQAGMAESTVTAREADLAAAKQQLQAMAASISQAQAQLAGAGDNANAAQAGVRSAVATQNSAEETIRQAEARHVTAVGQLHQAQTQPKQVAVSTQAQAQAQAKVDQTRAALAEAQINLQNTRIYAPVGGKVSAKSVEVGMLAQPLTPLLALVQTGQMWVVANYKETQLTHARTGQAAEVTVDALPGKLFRGHVDSLSAGTGSTFALLPPDNASGNFTKVVQRVPVRILLDPGQPDMDRLRAGLSVYATVVTG